jgi:inosose dehydratase
MEGRHKMNSERTRRQFLHLAALGTAATWVGTAGSEAADGTSIKKETVSTPDKIKKNSARRLELGLASYSLRNFNLDETLAMTRRVGLMYICLKSMHLPLESTPEEIAIAAGKVKKAGLKLYGGGVIYMKNEKEVVRAFEYAQAAGMETIVGVPNPEHLELVNEKVKQYDIKVAIHNHGPGDKIYPTPASAYEKIKKLDKRIGLCMDIGHTMRAGVEPSEAAQKFADRLHDIHIKDVTAAQAQGKTVEIGRGIIDIPGFLRTLLRIKYAGVVSFEYEKDAPDPLPGLAESVGFVKGVLAAL